jgi:hypothetical protein
MPTYRCPVCKKDLTQQEYESVLGILEEKEKHLKRREEKIHEREKEFVKQRAQLLQKIRTAKQEGETEGQRKERLRAERLMAGQRETITKLQDRIRQLKCGSTPQTDGLEFEEKLATRLGQEFPEDTIKHVGKGGDILHFVMHRGKNAGIVVYECKRSPKIEASHVNQALEAKQERDADFAVLVTTGQRRRFAGLGEEDSVLIVSPLGVVALASLLRAHLIELLKARISKEERIRAAQQLVAYVTSAHFRNSIEEVIARCRGLQDSLTLEVKQHFKAWQQRWDGYQRLAWNTCQIAENVELVLDGKTPKAIRQAGTTPIPLPLPQGPKVG